MKIIAIDFDGTLVEDKYPEIGAPNIKLLEFIRRNRKKYIFILNTLRKGKELYHAVQYLKMVWDIEFDYVNRNEEKLIEQYGDSRKIAADYYIDDKNLTLDNWEEILGNE